MILSIGQLAAYGGDGTRSDDLSSNPLCWGKSTRWVEIAGPRRAAAVKKAASVYAVSHVDGEIPPNLTRNPGGFYAFAVETTPLPQPWSGATRIDILVFVERADLLQIRYNEVFSLLSVNWITDRLLHVRVALGREVVADYIFDVVAGVGVFQQVLEDGSRLVRQAQEFCNQPQNKNLPECTPDCAVLPAPSAP